MNKRLLGGLLAAGIIGGGVYGFAATLDVNSSTLAAGDDDVVDARCDDEVDTSYTTSWNGTLKAYEVATVTVSSYPTACDGFDVKVALAQADGTKIGEGVDTLDAGSTTLTIPTGTSAELVDIIHVVIDG